MRRAGLLAVVGVVAAVLSVSANAAAPTSFKLSACVNANVPQQMVITQTWRNAVIPAASGSAYTSVVSWYYATTGSETTQKNFIDFIPSGTQTDTFNPWVGTAGFVPWNDFNMIDIAYVGANSGGTFLYASLNRPKTGWRACR